MPERQNVEKREPAGLVILQYRCCDEEATDHEEDVDADKASVPPRNSGMKENHRDNRESAQSFDFTTMVQSDPGAGVPRLGPWRKASCRATLA